MPFRRPALLLWLFYFALAIAIQFAAGSFVCGFGVQVDESAHFVTGLMVRDYLAIRSPASPLRFAEMYYLHYPAVAFGHWPPLFHFLEAAWTLVFPASRSSILVLLSSLTAVGATALHRAASRLSPAAACFAGLFFLVLPLVRQQTGSVMTEGPAACFAILAMLALARFLETGATRHAAAAGLLLAAAILTRPTAWALGIAVPLAFLFSGNLLRFASFPAALLASLALIPTIPVYAVTLRMQRAGLEHRHIDWQRISSALRSYAAEVPATLGIAGTLATLAGIAFVLWPHNKLRARPLWSVLFATLIGVGLFNSAVPTVADTRKLFLLLPVFVLFAAATVHFFARSPAQQWMLAAMVLGASLAVFPIRYSPAAGLHDVARILQSAFDSDHPAALIASTEPGVEPALIAETLALEPVRPSHFVVRASKLLASSGWNGADYFSRCHSPQEVQEALDAVPINLVAFHDDFSAPLPHLGLLREALHAGPWRLTYAAAAVSAASRSGRVEIYRRIPPLTGHTLHIFVDLSNKLGRSIELTQ
jgi:hypothetical protein